MQIVVAGDMPITMELSGLLIEAGHRVHAFHLDEFRTSKSHAFRQVVTGDTDIIIEADDTSVESKKELLQVLDDSMPDAALLLTSALATSVTQAASWTQRPHRVVGYGILSPLGREPVVEIASALQTADQALVQAVEFWRFTRFSPVIVDDGPGLVRARILCCLINEAVGALMEGVASAEDIDKAMKLGTNYPMGPLAWADHLGLDLVYAVMNGLYSEWREDRYRPSPLLRRKVLAGHLGEKSGRGFYEY